MNFASDHGFTPSYRESVLRSLSDAHKDAYGFRPGPMVYEQFSAMNDAQLETAWAKLCDDVAASMRNDRAIEAAALVKWNAYLGKLMAEHGICRATAICWDAESYGVEGDAGFYCWHRGIPYTFESEVQTAFNIKRGVH